MNMESLNCFGTVEVFVLVRLAAHVSTIDF